ncbi:MAG: hypothetical protein RSB41_00655 [Bacilli bacterium]
MERVYGFDLGNIGAKKEYYDSLDEVSLFLSINDLSIMSFLFNNEVDKRELALTIDYCKVLSNKFGTYVNVGSDIKRVEETQEYKDWYSKFETLFFDRENGMSEEQWEAFHKAFMSGKDTSRYITSFRNKSL